MALLETGMARSGLIAGFANGLMWTGWTITRAQAQNRRRNGRWRILCR